MTKTRFPSEKIEVDIELALVTMALLADGGGCGSAT
jgi:hypothetical protein